MTTATALHYRMHLRIQRKNQFMCVWMLIFVSFAAMRIRKNLGTFVSALRSPDQRAELIGGAALMLGTVDTVTTTSIDPDPPPSSPNDPTNILLRWRLAPGVRYWMHPHIAFNGLVGFSGFHQIRDADGTASDRSTSVTSLYTHFGLLGVFWWRIELVMMDELFTRHQGFSEQVNTPSTILKSLQYPLFEGSHGFSPRHAHVVIAAQALGTSRQNGGAAGHPVTQA